MKRFWLWLFVVGFLAGSVFTAVSCSSPDDSHGDHSDRDSNDKGGHGGGCH